MCTCPPFWMQIYFLCPGYFFTEIKQNIYTNKKTQHVYLTSYLYANTLTFGLDLFIISLNSKSSVSIDTLKKTTKCVLTLLSGCKCIYLCLRFFVSLRFKKNISHPYSYTKKSHRMCTCFPF